MKRSNRILYSLGLSGIGLALVSCPPAHGQTSGGGRDRHSQALEWRRMRLQNEQGEIPADAWMKALAQKKQMQVDPFIWPTNQGDASGKGGSAKPKVAGIQSSSWTWLGPGNIGGRVRSILIHPTDARIMWTGGVGGGVWKTLNGGGSWFPLDDFMASLAISCMIIDPANPDLIYAGTGEIVGTASPAQTGGFGISGAGIFKTADGGTTWAQLSSTTNSFFRFVNRLAISPDSQTLLAGTWAGILRSVDGGLTWSNRTNFTALDLAFDPSDSSKCVASGFGLVLFSTDGGMSWTNSLGIPTLGRVEIAYAPSNPNIVYASVDNHKGEIWKSADGGRSFGFPGLGYNYLGDQGSYDNCIWVDPTDPNIVVVGGIDLWISLDGGAHLALIGEPHPDQHIIVNHPAYNGSSQRAVFIGNDGGVFKTPDIRTALGPGTWTSLNNNLGITEFYSVAGSLRSDTGTAGPGYIIGGTQDNNVLRLNLGDGPNGWGWRWLGDGGFCAIDPTDPRFFYGEYIHLQIERSTELASFISAGIADAGYYENDDPSANFIAPFILDPNDSNTMLAGGWRLWRSTNVKSLFPGWSIIKPGIPGGSSVRSNNVSAITVAQGNSDIIWVGHNGGEIFATMNGTAASPTWTAMGTTTTNFPKRFCTRIAIDPVDPNLVYVTFGGFASSSSSSNIWKTTDGGGTWACISSSLPVAPVNTLVIDPGITSRIYVGTEVGIFASADGGAHWSPGNDGPANVAVDELAWMGPSLLAATHGRGCFLITPGVWVEFNTNCPSMCGDGSLGNPFNKLELATNVVSAGGTVFFRPGTSGNCIPGQDCFPMTIRQPMTLEAPGGAATIGQ